MMQASKGVVFAAFELKVDSLMALAINYTDLLPLVNASVNASAPFISAIAFRYNTCLINRSQQASGMAMSLLLKRSRLLSRAMLTLDNAPCSNILTPAHPFLSLLTQGSIPLRGGVHLQQRDGSDAGGWLCADALPRRPIQ